MLEIVAEAFALLFGQPERRFWRVVGVLAGTAAIVVTVVALAVKV